VIIGLGDLQCFLDIIRERYGWESVPARADVLEARQEAISLNDGSGSFAAETAAMFFALSNVDRFGSSFRRLAGMYVVYVVEGSSYDLSEEDTAYLPELQRRIASGLASWEECEGWFRRSLVRIR
jgi:hypothetical protein